MASMNQSKQIVKTENQIVSTSYSEMGIEYIKSSYKSKYQGIQNDLYNRSRINDTWTNSQFSAEVLKSKIALLNQLTNSLYDEFNKNPRTIEIQIFNYSLDEFTPIKTTNFIQSSNFSTYTSSNNFKMRSIGTDQSTENFIDITLNLPENIGTNRTASTGVVTGASILDKYYDKFCVQGTCVNNRLKGNSGNDSINSNILSKGQIQIAKIKDFTTSPFTLFSRTSIEFKANQIRLNNFKLISEQLYFNFPAAASDKLIIKDSILIVNKLKFSDKVKSRDLELQGSTKICFLSQPTNADLDKLDWKSGTPNYIVLTSSNLNNFKTACGIDLPLSSTTGKYTTSTSTNDNLFGKIDYN